MRLRPTTGVTLTLLFLSLSIMMFTVEPVSSSSTVHNINTDLDYATIQEAIDAPETSDGHTIQVDAGTYYEHVIVDKSLTLVGEDESTIVDGNGTGTAFYITADNVQLQGFTIQNAREGIWIKNSDGHTIRYNTITTNRNEGIIIQNSSDNIIDSNTINSNGWEGIYIEKSLSGNVISGNTIRSNGFDGICTWDSNGDVIIGNTITSNDWNGISLQNSIGAAVSGNAVSKNGIDGLHLLDCGGNTFNGNTISVNNASGVSFLSSKNNTFYHNNIINNTKQVDSDESSNIWDNGAEGNYWSDYMGADLNGDGIGDSLYTIDQYNEDNHPLMNPWALFNVFDVTLGELTYQVVVSNNSTVASFSFNHSLRLISFSVTGPSGKTGFCNVTIPKQLLSGPWLVLANSTNITANTVVVENSTHTSLYFTFVFSTYTVKILEVDAVPPVANVGQDQTVMQGTLVTFDASGSEDNVGIVSYEWDFDDGTPTLVETDPVTTHTYTEPGTYTVTLTVKDAAGNTGTDSITVTVTAREEAFPFWIVAVVVVIGITIATAFLWKKK